ncbi:TonB-dependent receptor [Catenovulum sp. 2E275]|uniref:TonB-dependent receptor n=1 Tax=Catenovulum sp. 2E275 TaxID=2980497 RepID=UPI0021D297EA|nr:TonB-dependent receptor [Catenovulum sp. 2E275]MCU4677388.1 TonB-dependent receptor [Catenovulum sp. 2E275]
MKSVNFIMCLLYLVSLSCRGQSVTAPVETFSFYIPRSDASTALTRIANKTNSQLLYSFKETENIQSNALIGHFTIQEALNHILQGTHLIARLNADSVIIVERIAQQLQTKPQQDIEVAENLPVPIETIRVQGYLGSILKSLNFKKFSTDLVDVISKEDLGKFPEQNVAESLQRVTGVTIDRESGEGRFVTVRGFGPEFNTVQYNGRVIASENLGREFSFDVLPTELINQAIIYKSVDASVFSGGIGSTINLVSAKPMEYQGLRSVFTLDNTYDLLSDSSYPHLFSLLSYSNSTQGILLSFNYQNRQFQNDSANVDGWFESDLSYVQNKSGSGDFSQAWIPRNFDLRREVGTRKRLGGTLVYEARFNEELYFSFDVLYSSYKIDSQISSSANWTHDSQRAFENVYLDQNGTLLYYQYFKSKKLASDFVQLSRNRPTDTLQLGANLAWAIDNDWSLKLDLSHSHAKNNNGGNNIFYVVGSPNANPIYDNLNRDVHAKLSHQIPITIEQLKSHILLKEGDNYNDLVNQVSLDFVWEKEFWTINKIQFGSLYVARNKQKQTYKSPSGWEFGGYSFELPDDIFKIKTVSNFLNGGTPSIWYTFEPQEYHDFLWSEQHINEQLANGNTSLPSDILTRKEFGGIEAILRPGDSWQVNEDPWETYLMAEFSNTTDWGNINGNLGLRYSTVNIEASGYSQELLDINASVSDPTRLDLILSDPKPISQGHSYSQLLPSLNIKLDIDEKHVSRVSLSKTVTRPTLDKLSLALGGLDGRVGSSTASAGNPKLAPYESKNLDLAYEWYYEEVGFLGVSGFYKSLNRFVSLITERETLLEHEEGDFFVTRPKNVQSLNVWGLEVAWMHHFTQNSFMPIFNGFGLQLNYTFSDSDRLFEPDVVDTYALEGLSDSYNVVLFYEHGPVDARMSYHHRDNFIRRVKGNLGQPEMVEGYGQVDLNFRYKLNRDVELFIQGVNILNEKRRTYSIYTERLLEYEESGTRYALGARINL